MLIWCIVSVEVVDVSKPYKIGTVEALKVKRTNRRHYLNLDAETVEAFGIEVGDILTVEIKEGRRPDEVHG